MKYVTRDGQRVVNGTYNVAQFPGQECLAADHPDIVAYDNPVKPNVPGFKAWLKANVSFTLRNLITQTYPNFMGDLNERQWDDFAAGCLHVRATNNIPVTLT